MGRADNIKLARVEKEWELRRMRREFAAPGGLIKFIKYFWKVLEPATEFVEGWALEAICTHLEAVSKGNIKRLLINVSPGFSKSLTTNAFWPAWEWATGAGHLRYVSFSYSAHLTLRDNEKFRDLIQSHLYQELYSKQFDLVAVGATKVSNNKTGWKFASSVGGVGTGERGDRILCLPYESCILTDVGPLQIGDIVTRRLNVKVLGFDHETGRAGWQSISSYRENPGSVLVELTHVSGRFECTPEHPVYVIGRGYTPAEEIRVHDTLRLLREGDLGQAECEESDVLQGLQERAGHSTGKPNNPLQSVPREYAWWERKQRNNKESVVSDIRTGRAVGRTFNLETDAFHNFVADGVLVHNCDDPHSVSEAESDVVRTDTVQWFREAMQNRLNSLSTGTIVVIMQRVHEGDVSGCIIENYPDYEHLMIPMQFEEDRRCTTSIGWTDPRTEEGRLAWPERYPEETLTPFKSLDFLWAGQYQQRPEVRGGSIIKGEIWRIWDREA